MDDAGLLAFLVVKPADLPPAPVVRTRDEALARITPAANPQPCVMCGAPAWLTRTVATEAGHRWLDLCRPHRLAVSDWRRTQQPHVPFAETVNVLVEAAESVGLRVRVIASNLEE
ncbi:hypothetical protein MUK60_07070 [Streptomyces sp. LRE541]|uniref:hypothetical protein n=1 Tax=Streptomyces sp. LRE541 TaxID=2931983 RepID=UPI00200DF4F0|nr:hypothetical protein [Streptomyces sp. LRE541]UPZ27592.1 hypothetical protein MUK60_07070 [Streptomyces sp. LRE541]